MPEQSAGNLPLQTQSARDHVPPAVTYVPFDFAFACLILILIGAGLWQHLLPAPMNFNQQTFPRILCSANCSTGLDRSELIFHFRAMIEVSLARGRQNFLTGKLMNSPPSFNADQFNDARLSCRFR